MNDSERPFKRLRIFNLVMGMFHLLQGIAMLMLSNDYSFTITTSFLKWNQILNRPINTSEDLFSFRAGPVIAGFLFLSSFAHFIIASPGVYEWYVNNLKSKINIARWLEYSLSASLMIVVIAMLSGMLDAPSLILLFSLNAMMLLFGWMMELHNQTTQKTNWTAFIFGSIAGIVPWIIIAWYFFTAINSVDNKTDETIPTFVYFILGSLFIFFNIFAVNMFLQYKKIGPWKNYLFGEYMYIVLSLVAKSLLAWQVFFGTLRPQ